MPEKKEWLRYFFPNIFQLDNNFLILRIYCQNEKPGFSPSFLKEILILDLGQFFIEIVIENFNICTFHTQRAGINNTGTFQFS